MDISTTYLFSDGIADDSFIGSKYSIKDMSWVDVQTEERYAQASKAFLPSRSTTISWSIQWYKNTPYEQFVSNFTTVQRLDYGGWVTLSLTWNDFDNMTSYGSWTDQVNYFFSRANWVKETNYDGSTVLRTITSGYAWSGAITAIWWNQSNILFSRSNVVYFMTTWTSPSFATAVTLRPWTIIKWIYSYTIDSVVIIWQNGNDTLIYEASYTWWAYNIESEITVEDYLCLSAVGSGYSMYWISQEWIHQYQWRQSQHIKYLPISSGWLITTSKWGVSVLDWAYFYHFKSIKPWRNFILTKDTLTTNATFIDWDAVLVDTVSWCDTYKKTQGESYALTNTITLRPLDWWVYQIPKHNLTYRFWYIFPPYNSYTNTSQRCSIKVEILTDEMDRDWTYIQVWDTYTGDSYWYITIDPSVISKALENAWYKSEFWYVETKITLTAWDDYTSPAWYYRKTPKLFDFTISADYVKR